MPAYTIDTIKPKNDLDFPVVEAVDVAVGEVRLPEALASKADTDSLANKANLSSLNEAVTNLQEQIDEIITPVTQDAEVQNARVNATGITFTTLKERLDNFENLTGGNFERFGANDASFADKDIANHTRQNVTFSYDRTRNMYHVEGTSTGTAFTNILSFTSNNVPSYIKKGELNYIHFITTDNNIECTIYITQGESSSYTKIATFHSGDLGEVFIPDDTKNLTLRLDVANGLTVDAYANASVVGSLTNKMLSAMSLTTKQNILRSCNLNSITENGVYLLAQGTEYENAPSDAGMLIVTELAAGWVMQLFFELRTSGVYKRSKRPPSDWSEWMSTGSSPENSLGDSTVKSISQKYITDNSSSFPKSPDSYTTYNQQTETTSITLGDIKDPGYYLLSSDWIITDAPAGSRPTGVKVEKYKVGANESFMKQTVETVSGNPKAWNSYYRYTNFSGVYQEWIPCGKKGFVFSHPEVLPNETDLNNLSGDSFWLMANKSGSQDMTYYNAPYYSSSGRSTGILMTTEICGWNFQLWFNFTTGDVYRRMGKVSPASWNDWIKISGGGTSITYNVTQNINRDSISNTYNITTSPTITTDTNGWLQAVDSDTQSEASKTDMSGAILSMLTDTGYCHLAPGIYYVSGFDMPAGSTIEGCGKNTIVRLLSSVSSGYAVRIGQNNTVKNICFSGGYDAPSDVTTEDTDLGSRHGVYLIANADGEEATAPGAKTNIVTGCFFENFDGSAFYNHNTGGGLDNAVIMSDCRIIACKVGINIDYYAEYSKFTNIIIKGCNVACINNGGNNVFTACTFHGVVGFLIDNTAGDKRNIAHGSCVGCTFNHINNMNNPSQLGMGDAILVKNASNGFIFNDCQVWYGKINIQNSHGITVNSSLIGGGTPVISIAGDNPAFILNCIFMQSPSITANTDTKIINCYLSTGAPVTL